MCQAAHTQATPLFRSVYIKLVALHITLYQEVALSLKKVGDPWFIVITTVSVYRSALSVQSIVPECIVLGHMSGEQYLHNRATVYGPVTEISASVQNLRFLQPSNLKL